MSEQKNKPQQPQQGNKQDKDMNQQGQKSNKLDQDKHHDKHHDKHQGKQHGEMNQPDQPDKRTQIDDNPDETKKKIPNMENRH